MAYSRKLIDLTNMKFGRWTVIKRSNKKGNKGEVYWECVCSCKDKTIRDVSGVGLRSGKSRSCGCFYKEMASEIGKKQRLHNKYKAIDKNTIEMITSNTKEKFYVDLEDFDKIKDYTWRNSSWGYICTTSDKTTVILHRLIMDFPDKTIDHKDRNPLNNRKSNLRLVTRQQNQHNFSISFDNTSGFIGVSRFKKNHWRARIVCDGKENHLGIYKNKEDAITARLKAELKYFGKDFSPQRHLFKEYGIE